MAFRNAFSQVQTTTRTEPTSGWTDVDRRMMARALELAQQGVGQVSPGPLVGCVIVSASGEVVGEGFYVFSDVNHAETIALAQAGEKARGGTAYVSLEPHAHHGRTPPCTDALIAAGIKRVVAPIEDLNPKVSGKGFAHLRAAGLLVDTGLLAAEAAQVNEAYLHYMQTGRPFVHLKLAVTLDGKIATRTGDSRWITGPEARYRAHELRHAYDAILVGANTIVQDDPSLTDRSGLKRRRPLVRVVLDDQLRLSPESKLTTTTAAAPVLVFGRSRNTDLTDKDVEIFSLDPSDLCSVLDELGRRSIQSVLVEGGGEVAGSFIETGLVNKMTFFIAPKIVGGSSTLGWKGVERMSEALELERVIVTQRGRDVEVTGYPAGQTA
ncbi:MAG TPA: bifunctional diaminohydroxyphosphoribosylaminopyrimidine deaminase/5-amino-6-(5-phosphoribosylamino)uracil reductase RibD [Pyrinomonadaceae bacterium]|nr:bifunctional diaminohydroxyphosphoribosylaminopyrimidine deaminase/5-amino-6-(5-phosphoribosylamino)uracil reductase RibD [Pyrinomonadaceae bacterium]